MTRSPHPRLVVDTNILVPALVSASTQPPGATASAGLIRGWRAGLCSLVTSDALLAECEEVLQRPGFGLSRQQARRLCNALAERAILVTPRAGRLLLTRDPDDDIVLKTAIAGKAHLLVTDNLKHFAEIATLRGGSADLRYRGVKVVRLGECLDVIRTQHAGADHLMRRPRRWP